MDYMIKRIPMVLAATGDSRSTLYNRIANGLWSKPVKISDRMVGWPEHEIEILNAARVAGKTDDEIRCLVTRLEAARSKALDGFEAFLSSEKNSVRVSSCLGLSKTPDGAFDQE